MTTSTGCLAVASAVAALSIGVVEDSWAAPPLPPTSCQGTNTGSVTRYGNPIYIDAVKNYASACGTYGSRGVCMASINQALQCAIQQFNNTSGVNDGSVSISYTLTVGDGSSSNPLSVDLTRDTSFTGTWMPTESAFLFAPASGKIGLMPSPPFSGSTRGSLGTNCQNGGGCLTITGATTSSYTTLVTPTSFPAFKGSNVNHLIIEHLTMKQPSETMVQGFYVTPYSSVKIFSNDGSQYGFHAAMQFSQTNPPPNLVQSPNAFASVASSGSGYSCNNGATTCLVALPAPAGCSSGATLDVDVTNNGTNGFVSGVAAIATPPVCSNGYPVNSAAIVSSLVSGGDTAASNASFYVAYTPSPLTVYNQVANQAAAPGTVDISFSSARAFTNTLPPRKILSVAPNANDERWGLIREGNSGLVYVPPTYNTTSGLWTLTMNNHLVNQGHDPWIDTYPAGMSPTPLVCIQADNGKGVEFHDEGPQPNYIPGGADVTVNDMVWINSARNLFEGMIGVQINFNSIIRGPGEENLCHAAGGGGFQIGQPKDGAIWGEKETYLISAGTDDDTVAIFNDNGTGNDDGIPADMTLTYPKTKIGGNIVDSALRYVNVDNNSAVTFLYYTGISPITTSCGNTFFNVGPYNSQTGLSAPTTSSVTGVRCDPCVANCSVGSNPNNPVTFNGQ